jgi:HAD superfamily hydrolase (TIGR01509 family)
MQSETTVSRPPLVHVFDLGDVLIFVHEDRFFRKLRGACRPSAPAPDIFREAFDRAAVDRGGEFDRLHPLLVREAGLTMSLQELRLAWNDIFSPNRRMIEFVSQAPQPRLLLSNTNEPHVAWFREHYAELLALFDHCIFSNEVGMRKPDLAIFRQVESRSGRPPGEHVLIDDMPQHVAGARAAGWHAIQFRGVQDCQQHLAALAKKRG